MLQKNLWIARSRYSTDDFVEVRRGSENIAP
jgi:hypothetical protein